MEEYYISASPAEEAVRAATGVGKRIASCARDPIYATMGTTGLFVNRATAGRFASMGSTGPGVDSVLTRSPITI